MLLWFELIEIDAHAVGITRFQIRITGNDIQRIRIIHDRLQLRHAWLAGSSVIMDTQIGLLIKTVIKTNHRGDIDHTPAQVRQYRVPDKILASRIGRIQVDTYRIIELFPLRPETQAGTLVDITIPVIAAICGIQYVILTGFGILRIGILQ